MSNQLKKSIPWLYFVAMVSQQLCINVSMSFLTFYITDRMLVAVTVMGTVMLAARIVDGIIGLFCGVIMQKVQLKLGQYRSWLLYAPIMVTLGTIVCFLNPNIGPSGKMAVVFIGYVLFNAGMSFTQLSQNGMMAKISGPVMEHRLAISAKIVQGQNLGTILAAATTLPLIMFFDSSTGMDGYLLVQTLYAVVGFIGAMALFMGTKGFDEYDPDFKKNQSTSAGIGTMMASTLKNSQLILVMICDAMRFTCMMFMISIAMYYFSYVINQPGMMSVSMTVQGICAFLMSLVAPQIVKRIGKKNAALATCAICAIGYGGIAMFAVNGYMYYIVFNAIAVAGTAIVTSCGVNLYLDAGEYQLYTSGKDNRTFIMSMYGFVIKIGFALSAIFVTFCLTQGGYEILADGSSVVANPATFVGLIGGIAAGLHIIGLVAMLFYKITDKQAVEYADSNHRKMMEEMEKTTVAQ